MRELLDALGAGPSARAAEELRRRLREAQLFERSLGQRLHADA
ncbi:MAG: hypothetical protein ACLGIV_10465 [Actinomycetes bacterium]